jgi:hypothetical protein
MLRPPRPSEQCPDQSQGSPSKAWQNWQPLMWTRKVAGVISASALSSRRCCWASENTPYVLLGPCEPFYHLWRTNASMCMLTYIPHKSIHIYTCIYTYRCVHIYLHTFTYVHTTHSLNDFYLLDHPEFRRGWGRVVPQGCLLFASMIG